MPVTAATACRRWTLPTGASSWRPRRACRWCRARITPSPSAWAGAGGGDGARAAHAGQRASSAASARCRITTRSVTAPTACRCGTCRTTRSARSGAPSASSTSSATATIARACCPTGRTTCSPWCTGATAARSTPRWRQIAALLGEADRGHAVLYSTRILKKTGLRIGQ